MPPLRLIFFGEPDNNNTRPCEGNGDLISAGFWSEIVAVRKRLDSSFKLVKTNT